jgi:hypothetical protein
MFTSQQSGSSPATGTLCLVMDDLEIYRRIEFPNETRLSWAIEEVSEDGQTIFGLRRGRVTAERTGDVAT